MTLRTDLTRLNIAHLKRCPLCGAVNSAQNGECFVCSWSGKFQRDDASIEEGLAILLERCPELVDVLLEQKPPTPLTRLRSLVLGLFAPKKLDIRI